MSSPSKEQLCAFLLSHFVLSFCIFFLSSSFSAVKTEPREEPVSAQQYLDTEAQEDEEESKGTKQEDQEMEETEADRDFIGLHSLSL